MSSSGLLDAARRLVPMIREARDFGEQHRRPDPGCAGRAARGSISNSAWSAAGCTMPDGGGMRPALFPAADGELIDTWSVGTRVNAMTVGAQAVDLMYSAAASARSTVRG